MKKHYLFCVIVLFTHLVSETANAQENKIKAIFLYKFIENTKWPNDKKELTIGMVGNTEVIAEFKKMMEAKKNTNLTIKEIKPDESIQCDIIYIPSSRDDDFESIHKIIKGESILLIAETSGLARKGAGISFLQDGTKLGFIINRTSLEARNLRIAKDVLVLSKEVI